MTRSKRIAILAFAASTALISSARGQITFNLVPANGMDPQAIAGFEVAADRWAALLSNAITVNIDINFTNLGGSILGQAGTNSSNFSYSSVRGALSSHRTTPDDFTAFGFLPTGNAISMLINRTDNNPNGSGSATPYFDNNSNANNTSLSVNLPNAKALGLHPANAAGTDASITFNNQFTWDFDPTDGITFSAYDFIGVATHEIGHALGFVSGVDILDQNSTGTFYHETAFTEVTTADLYRFSTDSIANGVGVIDWTADTRDKYFSINGGTTHIASFATGVVWGDTRQASHWKDNLFLGIMDPTGANGELLAISANDRQLFDVIGYTPGNTWEWAYPSSGIFEDAPRWSSDVVPDTPQTAVFNQAATYTVTFALGPVTNTAALVRAGNVTFALAPNSYTLSGALSVAPISGDNAQLTIQGGTLNTGSATLAAAVSTDAAVTLTNSAIWNNSGNLHIGGDSNGAGGNATLTINSGTLNVGGTLKIHPTGTLTHNAATALTAGAIDIDDGQLLVTSSTPTAVVTESLAISVSGKLDLYSNALIVHFDPTDSSPLSILKNQIVSGRGGTDFANATWAGPGINSAIAAGQDLVSFAIGYVDNSFLPSLGLPSYTSFFGQTVDANSVLIRYTLGADANLDGRVNTDDVTIVGALYNNAGSGEWFFGDFDYDGICDTDDVTVLGAMYDPTAPPLSLAQLNSQFGPEFAAAFARGQAMAAVPEPTALTLLGLGAIGALPCRRRRQRN